MAKIINTKLKEAKKILENATTSNTLLHLTTGVLLNTIEETQV